MQRGKVREVQVVVKWGGELTVGGLQRAEILGSNVALPGETSSAKICNKLDPKKS